MCVFAWAAISAQDPAHVEGSGPRRRLMLQLGRPDLVERIGLIAQSQRHGRLWSANPILLAAIHRYVEHPDLRPRIGTREELDWTHDEVTVH